MFSLSSDHKRRAINISPEGLSAKHLQVETKQARTNTLKEERMVPFAAGVLQRAKIIMATMILWGSCRTCALPFQSTVTPTN